MPSVTPVRAPASYRFNRPRRRSALRNRAQHAPSHVRQLLAIAPLDREHRAIGEDQQPLSRAVLTLQVRGPDEGGVR
jgi:hypothetical protein